MSEHEQEIRHMIDPSVPELTPLETMRHSAAHVMADAVKRLFPEAKITIGPPIENGFYYDFDVPKPFTDEDLDIDIDLDLDFGMDDDDEPEPAPEPPPQERTARTSNS